MAVSGAQDSFALLTDENLYNDVKGIMDLQKELTGQAQEELQRTYQYTSSFVFNIVFGSFQYS